MYLSIDDDDFKVSRILNHKVSSYLYGEANYESVYEIIKKFSSEDSYFLDVGSGCGKIVIYLAKNLNILADGVEIDINRYLKSLNLIDKFDLFDRVEFINQSFENIYFGNYNMLYCCNLIFTEEDNLKLFNKILKEFQGYFFLFDYNLLLEPYLIDDFMINTSWNKKQYLFVFKK